jgi:ribosome-associated protein
VKIVNLEGLTQISDYFVVCTATSDTHAKAITDAIVARMKQSHALLPRAEGKEAGSWVLIDYGDVVAHVFLAEARAFYDIEGLWKKAAGSQ